MCFDYVERFALLLNDLNVSIKLPAGNIARNFLSDENPHNEHCLKRKPPPPPRLVKLLPLKIALQQIKNKLSYLVILEYSI